MGTGSSYLSTASCRKPSLLASVVTLSPPDNTAPELYVVSRSLVSISGASRFDLPTPAATANVPSLESPSSTAGADPPSTFEGHSPTRLHLSFHILIHLQYCVCDRLLAMLQARAREFCNLHKLTICRTASDACMSSTPWPKPACLSSA